MAIAETNGQRFVACGKYSDNNGIPSAEVERIIDEHFQPMHISDVTRVRWFLAKYDPPEAMDFTKFVDVAWEPAFTDKEKRQAMIFHAARGDYSFVYKPDQKKNTRTVEGTEPDVYQLVVPANRYDQHKTNIDVVSQLLEAAEEYTANMQLEGESRATGNADAIVDRVSAMTNEEFERECLEAKMASKPDDYQACLKKAKPELKGLRNERSKRQMKEPIVFRVGRMQPNWNTPAMCQSSLRRKARRTIHTLRNKSITPWLNICTQNSTWTTPCVVG